MPAKIKYNNCARYLHVAPHQRESGIVVGVVSPGSCSCGSSGCAVVFDNKISASGSVFVGDNDDDSDSNSDCDDDGDESGCCAAVVKEISGAVFTGFCSDFGGVGCCSDFVGAGCCCCTVKFDVEISGSEELSYAAALISSFWLLLETSPIIMESETLFLLLRVDCPDLFSVLMVDGSFLNMKRIIRQNATSVPLKSVCPKMYRPGFE